MNILSKLAEKCATEQYSTKTSAKIVEKCALKLSTKISATYGMITGANPASDYTTTSLIQ